MTDENRPTDARTLKLSKRVIDAAAPETKPFYLWDDKLKGFGVRIMPSGIKAFVVVYRNRGGRQRWHTIARMGVITPDEARLQAVQLLAAVARGDDPQDDRRAYRDAPALSDLLDAYERDHVAIRNKESTRDEVARILKARVRGTDLAKRKVADISTADIRALHANMASNPRQANFLVAVLSKAFSLAEAWQMRPPHSNPCRGIEKYREIARNRFFRPEELARLGAAISAAEVDGSLPAAALAAIRLLALSGARLSEIATLTWERVDLASGLLRLPDTKTGPKILVMGKEARLLLQARAKAKAGNWVFPSADGVGPISVSTMEKVWGRLRKSAKLDDARLHDLRHTVGTLAAQRGANAFLVRDKLGHTSLAMTGRYVSQYVDPLRELSDGLESVIAGAMGGALGGAAVKRKRPRQ